MFDLFRALDNITIQLSSVWTRLNTPTFNTGVSNRFFGWIIPENIISWFAPTPLSLFLSGFLVFLSLSLIVRFVRFANPLA